ncbi:PKD-like domain-containing protein, partial [Flavobacterium sp. HJJ]|uniref:PKD-like domain-containing protein n=1 Tax=Flavobacterium sp. HJJ TaxID=2783792 RepID=UPI00188B90A3
NKAVLTITADDQIVVYGTTSTAVKAVATYTVTGFVNGENSSVITGSVTYTTPYTSTTAPGTAGVTITPVITGLTAANYSFSAATGTITITKANSAITATGSISFTYTGLVQGPTTSTVTGSTGAVTYSYSGTGVTTYGPSATRPINAGTYQVIASVASDANYNAASSSALAFTINKATITITASNRSKCYGTALTLGTTAFTASGLQNGETITSVTLTSTGGYDASLSQTAGSYIGNIMPSNPTGAGFSASNYAITFVGGDLTINDKPTIANITAPAALCPGASFSPAAPAVTDNGSVVSSQGWEISTTAGGSSYSTLTLPYVVAFTDNGKNIRYKATNGCGGPVYSNVVSLSVSTPVITPAAAVGTAPYTFTIDNPNTYATPNANGGQYALINVVKGFTYTFSVGDAFAGSSEVLTILDASNANVSPAATAAGSAGSTITNWVSSLSGQIKVVLTEGNCAANGTVGNSGITVTLTGINNTQDNQLASGTDSWIGHVYNIPLVASPVTGAYNAPMFAPSGLTGYAGYYTESESFGLQQFGGGNQYNFPVYSNGGNYTNIDTQGFAVRYRMTSTRPAGCYLVTIKGDDGTKLYVGSNTVVANQNNWGDHGTTTYASVLVNFPTNSTDLVFDYYENAGLSETYFSIVPYDQASNVITPAATKLCSGTATTIKGSYDYDGNPNNVNSNPSFTFSWESNTNGAGWVTVAGETGLDYTPPALTSTTNNIVTQYRRTATPVSGTCGATVSNVITITTSPIITIPAPVLAAATNVSCTGFTANWASVNTALNYKLDVSTVSNFTSFVTGYNGLDVGAVTSYNVTGTSGTTYYYRVRAYNACAGNTSADAASGQSVTTSSSPIAATTQVGTTQTFCTDNGMTYTSGNAAGGQYVLVNVIKGFTYTFSVGNAFAGYNENITILDAATDASVSPAASATSASGVTITNWVSSLSGQIKVVLSAVGCNTNGTAGTSGITVTQTAIGNTQETQNEFGTNTWVGHIYNAGGTAPNLFDTAHYAGYYNVPAETITEGFGGNTNCFAVYSGGSQRAGMYTEGFAVRYKMKTTRNGCYLVNVRADDGVRLSLNGTTVIDKWIDQGATSYNNTLVSLDGNDDFVLDYYENGVGNEVSFSITAFNVSTNTITPAASTICSGTAVALNGSSYLVNGAVNPSLTFQWESSPASTGPWTNTGVTTEDYSVSPTITTYYRRVVTGSTANNSGCSVTSDPVVITVNTPAITNMTAASCSGSGFTVSPANGTNGVVPSGTTYTWSAPSVAGITGTASGTSQANISGTLTNTTNAPINVVYTVTPTAATCIGTAFTVTVTVNPLPNNVSSGFSATTMCAGGSPQLTFDAENLSFSAPYSITYQNDTTLAQYTITIPNASAYSFAPGGSVPTVNTGYTLLSISNATCTRTAPFVEGHANLIVRPMATATISGTTTVCVGAVSPNITFTNPRTVIEIVTYTINGGADQTIEVASNNGTSNVAVSTIAGGSFVYSLKSVVYKDTPACSNTITGQSATVTVNALPSITAQPSNSGACEADNASFTVAASGAGLTYQWQLSTNGGGTFNNLSNGGVYSNVTAATMNITTAAIGMDTYQYRCVISGTCTPSVTSNAVTLSVNSDSGDISLNGGTPVASSSIVYYCPSTTAEFSIALVPGATGYNWTLPAGWSVLSGSGTNKITVTTGTSAQSGNVFVTANNMFCPSYIWVSLTSIAPSALIITKIDPTCAVPTGTVKATPPSSVMGTLTYTLIKTSVSPEVAVAQNGTGQFTNLAAGDYAVTYQIDSGCYSDRSNSVSIVPLVTKTWNGSWSPAGVPSINDHVIFDADYSLPVSVNSCSCVVNSGKKVTIGTVDGTTDGTGLVLNILNGLNVQGELVFENNASLVQTNEAVNQGAITYKRTTPVLKDYDYVYWSSPVENQLLSDLWTSDRYYRYTTGNWEAQPSSTIMGTARGYIIRVRTSDPTFRQSVEFKGVPINGLHSIRSQGAGRTNLIGNPYPSAIDAESFIRSNIDVIGSNTTGVFLYFWTHFSARKINGTGTAYKYNADDYALFNLTGASSTAPSIIAAHQTGVTPTGKIAAGQSFFVVSEADDYFKFDNSMRFDYNDPSQFVDNSEFFRQSATKKTAKTVKDRVWLNLTNTEGVFKQLLVGYITGATNDFDKLFDGITLNSNAYVDFYSVNNSKGYTIQGRAQPFDKEDTVPLGYKSTIAGTFQIGIDNTDGGMVNQAIYLEDKLTNTIHDLKTGSYSFTTATGVFNDRFVLRYTNTSKLGTGDTVTKNKGVFVSVRNRQIKVNSFDQTISSVKVYDLKGSLLYDKNKVNKNEFIVDTLNAADQVMIVMIELEDGTRISEEIIFHE